MRKRHPLVLLGALIARHIEVRPVDHDAISALLVAEAQKEAEAQAQAWERPDRLGSLGSQADGSRLC